MSRKRVATITLLLVLSTLSMVLTSQRSRASVPTIRLLPPQGQVATGAPFAVAVQIDDGHEVAGFEFDLLYDERFLELSGVTVDPAFGQTMECDQHTIRCALVLGPRRTVGGASVGAVSYGSGNAFDGSGRLALLHFQPTGSIGTTAFTLTNALVTNHEGRTVTPLVGDGGTVSIGQGHHLFLPSVLNRNSIVTERE